MMQTKILTQNVVIVLGAEANRLVPKSETVETSASNAQPLYAATLALRKVLRPERVFALALDQSICFGIHSLPVSVSNSDSHVLHVFKYNDNQTKTDAKADKEELMHIVSLLQPGWEEEAAAVRYLPKILVANDTHRCTSWCWFRS